MKERWVWDNGVQTDEGQCMYKGRMIKGRMNKAKEWKTGVMRSNGGGGIEAARWAANGWLET